MFLGDSKKSGVLSLAISSLWMLHINYIIYAWTIFLVTWGVTNVQICIASPPGLRLSHKISDVAWGRLKYELQSNVESLIKQLSWQTLTAE